VVAATFAAAVNLRCGLSCSNDVLQKVTSPDRKHVMLVVERNCGATTDYAMHVQIRDAGGGPDSTSNSSVLIMGGRTSVDEKWIDARHVQITHGDGEVFKQSNDAGSVSFTFVTTSAHVAMSFVPPLDWLWPGRARHEHKRG